MMTKGAATVAVAAPSFGPAVVTFFGLDVPVLAFALSLAGLVLARFIAPKTVRKLSFWQEVALTALLALVLFVIVTGAFGSEHLSVGMAVIWGVGLGFSGLIAIEIIGDRVKAMLSAMMGRQEP